MKICNKYDERLLIGYTKRKRSFITKAFYKLLYRILKKDMIEKLRDKHGEQFIDDIMKTFNMPTKYEQEELISNGSFSTDKDWYDF